MHKYPLFFTLFSIVSILPINPVNYVQSFANPKRLVANFYTAKDKTLLVACRGGLNNAHPKIAKEKLLLIRLLGRIIVRFSAMAGSDIWLSKAPHKLGADSIIHCIIN